MPASSPRGALPLQAALVGDDGVDLFRRQQRAEVGHAAPLHGETGISSGPHRGCLVSDAAHAVGLAELGAFADEVNLQVRVGKLPELGPVCEVGTVGAGARGFRITV